MPRSVVIESLPQALRVIKEMNLSGEEDSDYRRARREVADRRNGSYSRHLLTELGDIELSIPRTRTFSAAGLLGAFARRGARVERVILACFVLGLSTRKVAEALLPMLGERVSAATVSRVAKSLDGAVASFHRRPIRRRYRFLILDGVVLKRRTGAGSAKRVVLVALGITPEGRKEVIDFFITPGERQSSWEVFLADLYRRGLTGEGLELIITDGGAGLLAALPLIYPHVPLQRCWVHKTRNVLKLHEPW